MTPQVTSFLQIVGGSLLGAIIVDVRAWASAPKGPDGEYPKWDWSCAVRSWTLGLITGITATGIVAAAK